jgi:hypothetical protein
MLDAGQSPPKHAAALQHTLSMQPPCNTPWPPPHPGGRMQDRLVHSLQQLPGDVAASGGNMGEPSPTIVMLARQMNTLKVRFGRALAGSAPRCVGKIPGIEAASSAVRSCWQSGAWLQTPACSAGAAQMSPCAASQRRVGTPRVQLGLQPVLPGTLSACASWSLVSHSSSPALGPVPAHRPLCPC